jgi:hypothetical protein
MEWVGLAHRAMPIDDSKQPTEKRGRQPGDRESQSVKKGMIHQKEPGDHEKAGKRMPPMERSAYPYTEY